MIFMVNILSPRQGKYCMHCTCRFLVQFADQEKSPTFLLLLKKVGTAVFSAELRPK